MYGSKLLTVAIEQPYSNIYGKCMSRTRTRINLYDINVKNR